MTDPFLVPQNSINWAEEAINESETLIDRFFGAKPVERRVEPHGDPGTYALKFVLVKPLPFDIARKCTEAINNIKNSFDQSLFAACAAIGRPVKDAHYPWVDEERLLSGRLINPKNGKILIPVELHGVIRAQQPYPSGEGNAGGDDIVRDLAKIANRKHTVGINMVGVAGDTQIANGLNTLAPDKFIAVTGTPWDTVKNELIIALTNTDPPYFGNGYHVNLGIGLEGSPSFQGMTTSRLIRH